MPRATTNNILVSQTKTSEKVQNKDHLISGITRMAPLNDSSNYDVKSSGNELMDWEAPKAQGLYDPQNEHEACGVGFIVAIDGKRNHKVTKATSPY